MQPILQPMQGRIFSGLPASSLRGIYGSAREGLPEMLYYAGVFDPDHTNTDPVIDTRSSDDDFLEEECDYDPFCGMASSSMTSSAYYKSNQMIINIRP